MADDRRPLAGLRVQAPSDAAGRHAVALLVALGAGATGAGTVLGVGSADDSGPVADWAGSGAMALTGTAGGPPLVAPGQPATAARAALLAMDAVAGRPLGVAGHRLLGERAALTGQGRSAPWSLGMRTRALPTATGWTVVSLARDDDLSLLPAILEQDVDGPPWEALGRWARERPSDEVAARAQLLGLPAAPIPEDPAPSWPPWRIASAGRRRPVFGQVAAPLVLDLSALWAGPLCASLLGLAGARVVRLESSARPDGGRRGCPPFDDLLHAGQLAVSLPFGDPSGRAALHDLVAAADVVVTSARPRALDQLGLDPHVHLAGRSDGVWVSVTAHPPCPDGAVWVGYGDDAAMAAGLLRRLPDGTPVPCGDAIADPLTGAHAALAALAGVRAGGRHHVEVSLSEVAASTLAEVTLPDAVQTDHGWSVPGEHGAVPVLDPVARPRRGRARPVGADTDLVLRTWARRPPGS